MPKRTQETDLWNRILKIWPQAMEYENFKPHTLKELR
jgi:hypothetical protein